MNRKAALQGEAVRSEVRSILEAHHALGPFVPPLTVKQINARLPRPLSLRRLWGHLQRIYQADLFVS